MRSPRELPAESHPAIVLIVRRLLAAVVWSAAVMIWTGDDCRAQADSIWIESSGKCYSTEVTPEMGWARARLVAEASAIRDALAISATEEAFKAGGGSMSRGKPVDYFPAFSELNMSTKSGRIVDEELLESSLTVENNLPVYVVRLRALVYEEKRDPDPDFRVDISTDRNVYYDRGERNLNDVVAFSVWASIDCYLYVFDIMADDSVMQLLPHVYRPDNFYSAAEGREGFESKLAKLPSRIVVGLPRGKATATDMLLLVALKKRTDFISRHLDDGLKRATAGAAFLDLQKWLVTIPRDLRAAATTSFIVKREQPE